MATPRAWMTRRQRDAYEAILEHVARSGLRVGDQLESYAELARRLGVSVTLLQRVVPKLARDGYLSVVRRVGTFVERLPPAGTGGAGGPLLRVPARASSGAAPLRVFAAESGRWARSLWRRLVSAFEEERPGIRVQFSMSAEETGPIAGADVVVVDSHRAQQMAGSLVELPSEGWPAVSGLLEPLADHARRSRERRHWPVMLGGTLLYANRRLLASAGMFDPEAWRTPMGVAEASDRYLAG